MNTISLEDNYFVRLMKYSEQKKMSVLEVLHNFIDELKLENESNEENDPPSWDKPLPQAIIDLLPKRKISSSGTYEDYKAEMEKQLRDDYESIP